MSDAPQKGFPVSIRFSAEESKLIDELHDRTGISRVEIVRRAVRLLRLEIDRRGGLGFILEELNPKAPLRPLPYAMAHPRAAVLNEEPGAKKRKL